MSLNTNINFRISTEDKLKFEQRCLKIGKPAHTVLRELVAAFNDQRLKVKPTEEQQTEMKELYE